MHRRIRQALVTLAVVVLAASLVPAVSANRVGPAHATCHQYCNAVSRRSHTPVIVRTEMVSARPGFHWSDAGIGFGVACGAILAGGGTFLSRRARRSRRREVEAAA